MVSTDQLRDPVVKTVPHRIVITGGPLAGKSTLISYLQSAYGDKARFMTEVATMLLKAGYPKPGRDVEFSEEWLDYINKTIMPAQLAIENGHLHAAQENRLRAMFLDRGLLDPSAYVPGGKVTLEAKYGLDVSAAMDRYTMVIHMQSLACIDPAEYDRLCDTNPERYDTADQAAKLDKSLQEAWRDHPNWHFIPADGGYEAVEARALALISPLLDKEIELKFKLSSVPMGILSKHPSKHITQTYVHSDKNGELRVRNTDDSVYEMAVKDKSDKARMEWEQRIPPMVYRLLATPDLPSVSKTRYYVPHGRHLLEIDVYDDHNSGLCIMECEFESESDADKFRLPTWASGAVEVTNDKSYKNAALAKVPA